MTNSIFTNNTFSKKAYYEWQRNAFNIIEETQNTVREILAIQKKGLAKPIMTKSRIENISEEIAKPAAIMEVGEMLSKLFQAAVAENECNFENTEAKIEDIVDVEAKIEDIDETAEINVPEEESVKEEVVLPKVNVTIQDADDIEDTENVSETKTEAASSKTEKEEIKPTKQEVSKPAKIETPKTNKKEEVAKNSEPTTLAITDKKEDTSNTNTHEKVSSESGTDEPVYEFEPDKADAECEALRHLEFAKGKFNTQRQFCNHMAATEEMVEASRNLVTAWAGTLGYQMIDTTKVYGRGQEEFAPYIERADFLLKNNQINQEEYDLLVRRITRQPRWDYFSMVPELMGLDQLFDRYFYNKYEWSKDLQKVVAAMNNHTEKRYGVSNKKNRGDNVAKSNVGISQNANNSTVTNADARPQQSSNVDNFMNSMVNAMSSLNPYMAMMGQPQQMVPQGAFNPQVYPQQNMNVQPAFNSQMMGQSMPNMNSQQMKLSNEYPQGYEMVPFV